MMMSEIKPVVDAWYENSEPDNCPVGSVFLFDRKKSSVGQLLIIQEDGPYLVKENGDIERSFSGGWLPCQYKGNYLSALKRAFDLGEG